MERIEEADDGELVRKFLADQADEMLGREIYNRVYKTIIFHYNRNFTSGFIRSQYTPDDFVSDVFGKVMKHLPEYDDRRAKLSTWVSTISENAARDASKSFYRELERLLPVYDDQDDVVYDLPASGPSAMQLLVSSEIRRALFTALRGLESNDQRFALFLVSCSGFSIQDTALIMGIPDNTVKSHLLRGTGKFVRKFIDLTGLQDSDIEAATLAFRESGLGITTEDIKLIENEKARKLFGHLMSSHAGTFAELHLKFGLSMKEIRKHLLPDIAKMFKRKFRKAAQTIKQTVLSDEQIADKLTEFIVGLRSMPHGATRAAGTAIPENHRDLFLAAELLHFAFHDSAQTHVSTPGSFIALSAQQAGLDANPAVPGAKALCQQLGLTMDQYMAIITDRVFPDEKLAAALAKILKIDVSQLTQLREHMDQNLAGTRGGDEQQQRIFERIRREYFTKQ